MTILEEGTRIGAELAKLRRDRRRRFRDLVGDYTGTIVADALGTHEAGARAGPGIVLAACWAHVFRRFDDIKGDHPEAEQALAMIGALYAIDAGGEGDVARIAELRRREAPPILDRLRS
jgi:hypothetical protein